MNDPLRPDGASPSRIGPFRIVEVLGEGGMGRVYLAEQDEPARRVALKVLRTASLGAEAQARFKRESELLAELEHPNIARLYASGTADMPTGAVPWLALELVRGVDLVRHAEAAGLDTKARLALLATVCRAVHHAHTRGVVHRDLKPANILVDELGIPKVLDFGVARVIDAEGTGMTQAGEVLGTVPYMSPEQLEGRAHRVDPRGDVYSLGVIGYQLLSGRLPYPGLDTESVVGALALLRTGEPVALGKVAPAARGDAETILMKALAADPARRYGSAVEFAADLERFVADQPIEARPPTVRYVLSVFVRRHRGLATGAALALLAILASTGFALRSAYFEAQARAEAESRAAELAAVNRFLVDMFKAADPEQARGAGLTVREVLDTARAALSSDPTVSDEVARSLYLTLGRTYLRLGDKDSSIAMLDRAAALPVPPGDAGAIAAYEVAVERGEALANTGRGADALALLGPLLDAPLPEGPVATRLHIRARIMHAHAQVATGAAAAALEMAKAAGDSAEAAFGPDDPDTVMAVYTQAHAAINSGAFDQALALLASVTERNTRALGADHPNTLNTRNERALGLFYTGQLAEAEREFEDIIARQARVLGDNHPSTMASRNNQVMVLVNLEKYAAAEALGQQVLDWSRATLGPEHARTLTIINNLTAAIEALGRMEEAEALYRDLITQATRSLGAEHPEVLNYHNNFGVHLMVRKLWAEACVELEPAYTTALRVLGPEHHYTGNFGSNYGNCLAKQGRHAQARPILEQARARLTASFGADHPHARIATERLRGVYQALGLQAEAAALPAAKSD